MLATKPDDLRLVLKANSVKERTDVMVSFDRSTRKHGIKVSLMTKWQSI